MEISILSREGLPSFDYSPVHPHPPLLTTTPPNQCEGSCLYSLDPGLSTSRTM